MDENSQLYVDYFAFLSNNGTVEDTDFVTEEDKLNSKTIPESISKMSLEIQLLLRSITEQDVIDTINSIPDSLFPNIEKQKAIIKYKNATSFDRYNADLNLVATLVGLSQQDLDEIFINGNQPI